MALLTSMFWFPAPENVTERVDEFLRFERRYLTESWDSAKIMLAATVPPSLSLLALPFWNRNLWLGLAVLVLMAVGKAAWSIHSAGDAGMSILIPASSGSCFAPLW